MELLSDQHLAARVVDIVNDSTEFAVLVTAYIKTFTHLDLALRNAIARGVRVHLVIRGEDGSRREKDRRREELNKLESAGVKTHELERLHAKAYLNESEAIVTSFNLVAGSLNSIEMGVSIKDKTFVEECLDRLENLCPDLKAVRGQDAVETTSSADTPEPKNVTGYCIGCGRNDHPYDLLKPLCRDCYKSSRRGKSLETLTQRCCHKCGADHAATLEKPICYACFKKLSADEKSALTG